MYSECVAFLICMAIPEKARNLSFAIERLRVEYSSTIRCHACHKGSIFLLVSAFATSDGVVG
jgi:hypothetical protein